MKWKTVLAWLLLIGFSGFAFLVSLLVRAPAWVTLGILLFTLGAFVRLVYRLFRP